MGQKRENREIVRFEGDGRISTTNLTLVANTVYESNPKVVNKLQIEDAFLKIECAGKSYYHRMRYEEVKALRDELEKVLEETWQ